MVIVGVIVTLEAAQDGHITQGVGGQVKMVHDQKVLSFVMYKEQMLDKMVSESMDVQEATSGAACTVDQVDDVQVADVAENDTFDAE
eukprot:g20694.t1